MSRYVYQALATVALAVLPGVAAASAAAVAELLPKYPRAELVEFEDQRNVTTHEVITGALRSKGGNIVPEDSEFVTGRRIASTWHIPDEQRSDLVYEFYRERLAPLGEILYECEGYGCGSSNHWANNIFGRQILYGPPRYQHYLVTRIERGATYYVSTYIAVRGTRKLYVHTDVIVAETQYANVGGAAIVDSLNTTGRFMIDAGAQEAVVDAIVEAMELQPLMRVAVVSHERKQRGESVAQSIERSRAIAEEFAGQLVAAGVNSTRIEGYGVGPLAPINRKLVDRIELVLINGN